jgi:hypothetical protein
MDSKDDKKLFDTPLPNSESNDVKNDDLDDYNPYRDDFKEKDIKEEKKDDEPRENLFEIDPDKGNISEQLGLDLDYPTKTKIILNNQEKSNPFNAAKNLEMNNDVPQSMDDFNPYGNENKNDYNDNNMFKENNTSNETRNFLENFKDAITKNENDFNKNNNFNNNDFNNFNNNNYNNNNNFNNNFNNNNSFNNNKSAYEKAYNDYNQKNNISNNPISKSDVYNNPNLYKNSNM